MFSKFKKVMALAATVALTASVAQAVTVDSVSLGRAQLDALGSIGNPAVTSSIIGPRSNAGVFEGVTANLTNTYRSPFQNASRTTFDTASFTAVTNSTAIFSFDVDQVSLSFIWGSPQRFDTLSLFNDGVLVARIIPGLANPGTELVTQTQRGARLVTLTDVLFDEIQFSNDRASFEFANLQVVSSVPLPAGGLLLLMALAGLVFVRRKAGGLLQLQPVVSRQRHP